MMLITDGQTLLTFDPGSNLMGHTDAIQHEIDTGDHVLIRYNSISLYCCIH